MEIKEAKNLDFNLKILQSNKIQALLIPASQLTKPFKLKKSQLELDIPSVKSASKNKVSIAIDLNEISQLDKKQKALVLSNLIYLIKICRKTNTNLSFINAKDKKDVQALLTSLGASSQQTALSTKPFYLKQYLLL